MLGGLFKELDPQLTHSIDVYEMLSDVTGLFCSCQVAPTEKHRT